jgi:hypothetical protein
MRRIRSGSQPNQVLPLKLFPNLEEVVALLDVVFWSLLDVFLFFRTP